jgi:Putative Flp pilus-assembly TadE/G-like
MRSRRVTPARQGFITDERGVSAILIAIMLVVIMGITALAVDGGQLYMQRRRMVGATDAATLAAAQWCAQNYGTAQSDTLTSRADGTATANVSTSARTGTLLFGPTLTGPWVTTQCNGGAVAGFVKSTYGVPTGQAFAPVLGFGSSRDVHATAIAQWGPAGGAGDAMPFMLDGGRLGSCVIPPLPGTTPTDCYFWWNNTNNGGGGSGGFSNGSWGTVGICSQSAAQTNQCPAWSWDVIRTDQNVCTNAGGHSLSNSIIQSGVTWALPLNYPDPTYACNTNGASDFRTLANYVNAQCNAGTCPTREFPVNNSLGQTNRTGDLCPPPCQGLDKFDVIGFVRLQMTGVYKGSDNNIPTQCTLLPEYISDNSKANGWCLATHWIGFSTDGLPGNGQFFGVEAIGLSG